MTLSMCKNEASRIEGILSQFQSANYHLARDEAGNLQLIFNNNRCLQLPIIPFRKHQLEVQYELFVKRHYKRFFLVRPRRSGKEVESWNLLIQGAIERPGLYFMIYPTNVRGRKILWDGAISLGAHGSLPFLNMIPKELISKVIEDEMKVRLKNGAFLQVIGSDVDPDALRGTNPLGGVFSEYAYQDPRVHQILMPVFRENGGWYILQTTFNGLNHAYQLMQKVKDNEAWFCRIDSCETLVNEAGERYITDEMIEEDRKGGMPEFMIQQEYYSIVQLNQDSMYFALEMSRALENGRIKDLYPMNKPVYTAWDLGMDDANAITVFQIHDNGSPYILYYFESSNKTFEYYIAHLKEWCTKRGLILSTCFAPHDGAKRDFFTKGDIPKTIVEFGQELGVDFVVVKKPQNKIMAIQLIRQILYRCRFDQEGAKRLIDALCNYSKEYDEKSGLYKPTPRHDWCSHPVDSVQTMTLAFEEGYLNTAKVDTMYYIEQSKPMKWVGQ